MTVNVNPKTWIIGTDITVSGGRGYSDSANVPTAYTPFKLMSFDSGTLSATANGSDAFDNPETVGAVPKYSNAIAGPFGGGQVASLTWTSAGQSFFGGTMKGSMSKRPAQGESMWIRIYHYFPNDFCFQNNGGGDAWGKTKWVRIQWTTSANRQTFQLGNWSTSVCNTSGTLWGMTSEGFTGAVNMVYPTQLSIPRGQWVCLEWQIYFSTTSSGFIRGWVDGSYAGEVTGVTMPSSESEVITSVIYGDYINGGSVINTWYIDEAILTFEQPDDTDSGGRPRIGTAKTTGAF